MEPEEALAFFRRKGLRATFDWRDMLAEEHTRAFTVAKMADMDLLATMRAAVDDALARGVTAKEFKDFLTPILQAEGWWGRQQMLDPLTGKMVTAQLGSPARLETIYRTNIHAAYAAGHWQEFEDNKDILPYLRYTTVHDDRVRPEHAALDGITLPVDHEFWNTHAPPNGFNCRCQLIPQTHAMAMRATNKPDAPYTMGEAPTIHYESWTNPRTGDAMRVPNDITPGFAYNPGKVNVELAHLQEVAVEKAMAMPASMASDALREAVALEATAAQSAQTTVARQVGTAALAPVAAEPTVAYVAAAARLTAAEDAVWDVSPIKALPVLRTRVNTMAEEGVSASFVQDFQGNNGKQVRAIIKPDDLTPQWMRDITGKSPAASEELAYRVSEMLDFHVVPETWQQRVRYDYPTGEAEGHASFQRWIPDAKLGAHFMGPGAGWNEDKALRFLHIDQLDWLLANRDRHEGNWMFDKHDRAWAIDNGLAAAHGAVSNTAPSSVSVLLYQDAVMATKLSSWQTAVQPWLDFDFEAFRAELTRLGLGDDRAGYLMQRAEGMQATARLMVKEVDASSVLTIGDVFEFFDKEMPVWLTNNLAP